MSAASEQYLLKTLATEAAAAAAAPAAAAAASRGGQLRRGAHEGGVLQVGNIPEIFCLSNCVAPA
jgi:hypothetical protein